MIEATKTEDGPMVPAITSTP